MRALRAVVGRQGYQSSPCALPALSPPAGAAAAADFVVGLHQAQPQGPTGAQAANDRWYILQGCSGSLRGGQVVGLLGPSGGWVGGWVGGRVCASPPACLCQLVGRHHVLHGPLRALQRCGANLMVGDSFSALSACRLRQDDAAEQHCGLSHGPGQRRGADWQRGGGRPQVGGQAGGRAGGWVGGSQLLQSWVCGMRPQNTRCLPISSNALPPSLLAPSPASAAGGATPRSPTCPRATCSCPP